MKSDELIRKGSEVTANISAGTTVLGGFFEFLSDYGIAIGALISILAYATNLYFTIKKDRREEEKLMLEKKEYDFLVAKANADIKQ